METKEINFLGKQIKKGKKRENEITLSKRRKKNRKRLEKNKNKNMADRLSENGETIQSTIDHIYFSKNLEERLTTNNN